MEYIFNRFLAPVWTQLIDVIEENYLIPDNKDATMIFAMYVHKKISDHRKNMQLGDRKIIVYQSEPLVQGEHWHPIDRIIENLEGADEVWDYDLQNIATLKKYGINAKFRPPAITRKLQNINSWEEPDIDILFYGSYSEYRSKMIEKLFSEMVVSDENEDFLIKTNFVWLYNIADKKLNDYIARSKIILNIKPFEHTTRQQQVRIFHPLMNNKCVLSEKCDINYFGSNIYEFSNTAEFHNTILNLLTTESWRVDKNKSAYPGWIGDMPNKSRIAIFYHVDQTKSWQHEMHKQLTLMQYSGLYDAADYIHFGINGNSELPYKLLKVNRIKYNEVTDSQEDTLKDLYYFSLANPDYKILFIHNKNAHFFGTEYQQALESWRIYTEHFTVWTWRDSIKMLLQGHDCVGTEWLGNQYSGNVWWATGEYLSTLDQEKIKECDLWLGSKRPNAFNFKSIGKNRYNDIIEQSEYLE